MDKKILNKSEISNRAFRVLNYLIKHKCFVRMRWNYGIQVRKVVRDGNELSYPQISEDTWCEISPYLKMEGDYQNVVIYHPNFLQPKLI